MSFKFIDVQQNTEEWYALRARKLTSSNLSKVMANLGKAFGEPAKKYAVNIAIEQITGNPIASNYTNEHMERGHEQEPIARDLYEQDTFCEVLNGGFYDGGFIGCSPDGRVGTTGGIEIKSVIASVHFANIKRGTVDPAYKWQCIGNTKFMDVEWLDFISYCADFPEDKQLFTHRLYAEQLTEEFKILDDRIAQFEDLVDSTKKIIIESNYIT